MRSCQISIIDEINIYTKVKKWNENELSDKLHVLIKLYCDKFCGIATDEERKKQHQCKIRQMKKKLSLINMRR